MTLNPEYRIYLNKNLCLDPGFFGYLKLQFHTVLYGLVNSRHVDLGSIYKFTVYEIPPQWEAHVLSTILLASVDLAELTPKQQEIAQMLQDLNPLDPKPVDLEFSLMDIVSWVDTHVKHFVELVPGGVNNYFGIDQRAWFNDYPIQTGTVLRAVDIGTLDNFPLHLFDNVFMEMRAHLLDFFVMYNKGEMPEMVVPVKSVEPDDVPPDESEGVTNNADI